MKLYVTAPLTTSTTRSVFVVFFLVALAAPAIAATAPAVGEPAVDEQALAQIVDLNKKAVAALEVGEPDSAMKDLQAAAKLAQEKGLANHDIMARTQLHLGICAIDGLRDRQRGLEHFARALAIRPQIKLTTQLATPALARDLRAARNIKPGTATAPLADRSASAAPSPATAPAVAPAANPTAAVEAPSSQPKDKEPDAAPAPVPPRIAGKRSSEPPVPETVPQPLYCPTADRGPPGQPVPLFCLTQPEVAPSKVIAYFRPSGGEAYTAVPMKRNPSGWMSATVPGKVVKGRSLQVYFEAQGPTGKVAAHNGKDDLPNVIALKTGSPRITPRSLAMIDVGAPPASADEATPLELHRRDAVADAEAAEIPRRYPRRAPGRLWIGLGAGSGYGWHQRLPLERRVDRKLNPGFSPAGLGHLAPEVGYQLTQRWSVSLQSRHQYLPASGSGDAEVTQGAPELAHALLLRVQYAMLDLGNFQLLGSLSGGGGDALRLQVPPNPNAGIATSDTVVAGRGVVGPGLAIAYNFSSRFVALIEARALAGIPQFAVLMEGTGTLQYTF